MKKLIIACAAVLVLGLGLTTVGHVLGGQFYSVYYNGALHPFSDAAQNFSDKFVNISDHLVTADDDDDSDFDTDWVQDYLETRGNAIEGYSLPKQSLDHITSIDLTLKGGDFEILYVSGAGTGLYAGRRLQRCDQLFYPKRQMDSKHLGEQRHCHPHYPAGQHIVP